MIDPECFADDLRVASGLQRYDSDVAVVLHQRALTDQRRALGPEHPDTLTTRFSIAQEMSARGDHAGAEDEFRAVLPHLERRLGLDHPVTLTLWFSIAREMAESGDHAGAAKEFRGMLPYLSRRLGPDHPHTLAAPNRSAAPANPASHAVPPRLRVLL